MIKRFAATAALLLSVSAQAGQQLLDAEDYGLQWPFTMPEAYLMCLDGNAIAAMDPESGVMYAVNGAANSKAKRLALEPLNSVWRENPELPGTRISVSTMIDKGLQLCD